MRGGECLRGYVNFDSSNSSLMNLHPRFSGGLWKHILLGSSFENLRQPQHWLNKRTLCLSACAQYSAVTRWSYTSAQSASYQKVKGFDAKTDNLNRYLNLSWATMRPWPGQRSNSRLSTNEDKACTRNPTTMSPQSPANPTFSSVVVHTRYAMLKRL